MRKSFELYAQIMIKNCAVRRNYPGANGNGLRT